jgi:endonuclease/exonuclease/phosphatase family metal-dependent hydrolase
VRVLSWNLFHGRSQPPAGRDLRDEFTAALAGWAWDVALLQECPPWWPQPLARACGATAHRALTSRNALLPVRRLVAERWPDLIKSNGGGCNAILVRGAQVHDHRVVVLRRCPERRVAHAVRLDAGWVGNVHAQVHSEERAQADLRGAALALEAWAGGAAEPRILGGDTNTRHPRPPGLTVFGGHDVDFLLGAGYVLDGGIDVLDRGPLSDHAPVAADLVRAR